MRESRKDYAYVVNLCQPARQAKRSRAHSCLLSTLPPGYTVNSEASLLGCCCIVSQFPPVILLQSAILLLCWGALSVFL